MAEVMEIPLLGGKTALIDATDWKTVGEFKWRAYKDGRVWYARTSLPSVRRGGKICWPTGLMHRMILAAPKDRQVDHINGNGLDNRRANLRIVNASQNQMNRKTVSAACGFRGVTFHKGAGKWQAAIKRDGKNFYLGLHETPEAASQAYVEAAKELFGEFAA